jgi:hypothetical protein
MSMYSEIMRRGLLFSKNRNVNTVSDARGYVRFCRKFIYSPKITLVSK